MNSQKPSVRVRRLQDESVDVTRIAEPTVWSSRNVIDVNYTIYAQLAGSREVSISRERHSMRHFSLPEIDTLAEMSGFERLSSQELVSGAEPSDSTWAVYVVLRRK